MIKNKKKLRNCITGMGQDIYVEYLRSSNIFKQTQKPIKKLKTYTIYNLTVYYRIPTREQYIIFE